MASSNQPGRAPEDAGPTVLIVPIGSDETVEIHTTKGMTVHDLKEEVATRMNLEVVDFQLLLVGSSEIPDSEALVCSLAASEAVASLEKSASETLSMTMLKTTTTLLRHEEKSFNDWCQIAIQLQDPAMRDEDALTHLQTFLDMYPALINWQACCPPSKIFKPLLGFAIDQSIHADLKREQCVSELLKRGARVHIRHSEGFLIELNKESTFVDHLKEKAEEFNAYEEEAIAAWRNVSSKLVDETSEHVYDEAEMARIVSDFCTKYPEMVNFQNNHVFGGDDAPRGYFGYAPLISFAGAQTHFRGKGKTVRQSSVEVLLRHGARVDTQHGGKTALEWMRGEGSLLLDWLASRLNSPQLDQAAFDFDAARPVQK